MNTEVVNTREVNEATNNNTGSSSASRLLNEAYDLFDSRRNQVPTNEQVKNTDKYEQGRHLPLNPGSLTRCGEIDGKEICFPPIGDVIKKPSDHKPNIIKDLPIKPGKPGLLPPGTEVNIDGDVNIYMGCPAPVRVKPLGLK